MGNSKGGAPSQPQTQTQVITPQAPGAGNQGLLGALHNNLYDAGMEELNAFRGPYRGYGTRELLPPNPGYRGAQFPLFNPQMFASLGDRNSLDRASQPLTEMNKPPPGQPPAHSGPVFNPPPGMPRPGPQQGPPPQGPPSVAPAPNPLTPASAPAQAPPQAEMSGLQALANGGGWGGQLTQLQGLLPGMRESLGGPATDTQRNWTGNGKFPMG